MRLYYDAETGSPSYTISSETGVAPEGDWIEIDDTLDLQDLTAWRVVDGELVNETLVPFQLAGADLVNERVGNIRKSFITHAPGQEMIYAAKEAEAITYLKLSPLPSSLDDFPFLAAEEGVTAPTAYELAQLWINMSFMWRSTAAQLENLRISTIAAVEGATSQAQIQAILTDFKGTLP